MHVTTTIQVPAVSLTLTLTLTLTHARLNPERNDRIQAKFRRPRIWRALPGCLCTCTCTAPIAGIGHLRLRGRCLDDDDDVDGRPSLPLPALLMLDLDLDLLQRPAQLHEILPSLNSPVAICAEFGGLLLPVRWMNKAVM